jgi:hypothetical protein
MDSKMGDPNKDGHPASDSEQIPDNPNHGFNQKKSYKQVLLAEAEGAANRTGINTFKLIHLIHSKKQDVHSTGEQDRRQPVNADRDVESMGSDTTKQRKNGWDWYTSRMRFQLTLSVISQ